MLKYHSFRSLYYVLVGIQDIDLTGHTKILVLTHLGILQRRIKNEKR